MQQLCQLIKIQTYVSSICARLSFVLFFCRTCMRAHSLTHTPPGGLSTDENQQHRHEGEWLVLLSLSVSLTHTYTHFIPAQHRHKLWSGCDNIIPPLRPHWGESIPNHRDRLPEPRPPSVTLPLPRLLIPQSWLQLTSPGPDERGSWGGGGEGERRGWERGRVRKNRQWEIVCMCSHMDFGANGIIRTLPDKRSEFVCNYQANLREMGQNGDCFTWIAGAIPIMCIYEMSFSDWCWGHFYRARINQQVVSKWPLSDSPSVFLVLRRADSDLWAPLILSPCVYLFLHFTSVFHPLHHFRPCPVRPHTDFLSTSQSPEPA